MTKRILGIAALLWGFFSHAQIVINELDADTPSFDVREFVELKSTTPNMSLDGYCLVFYNNSNALSYFAIDLDGMTTDVNGILLLGNAQVTPAPAFVFPNSSIQNGPDVVALYQANASDFPLDTPPTTTGLIDTLAYSNAATTTPATLMTALGITVCTNENQNQNAANQSIQRNNDGTYSVATPTPGVNNDGSGIILNGITLSALPSPITEGQSLTVTFTTTNPVVGSPLILNFSLINGSFTTSDYSGSTTVTIPVGGFSASSTVVLIDDALDEGDEELNIKVEIVPNGYVLNNNNIIIRVADNDFVVSPWGTPLNPTYGMVTPTTPNGYYESLEGLSGVALKQALQNIIADPNTVRAHTYGDIVDILKVADQHPQNGSQVWLMYVETPRSKLDYQTGNSNIGLWNREHIWPQSRGGFADGTSPFADGIQVWLPTGPDDILAGHSDAHHIRAEDGPENTLRSNRDYGSDYNGPAGNSGSWKGDVARALFYMAVRYNGLDLINGNPVDTTVGQMGDLASLLSWNQADPADDFEMNRNNYIYTWQYNRNPFIDYPLLADYLFGSHFGDTWSFALQQNTFPVAELIAYPNPAKNEIYFSGIQQPTQLRLFDVTGKLVLDQTLTSNQQVTIGHLEPGVYMAKVSSVGHFKTIKIVVQ